MSTPVDPRYLQLPPSQRAQAAFREQRKQKLKEHMLKRKTFFAYKQENQIFSSSRNKGVMTSEGQVQEETKVLKLKTKMADKENVHRITRSENNITMGKNCIPLKPSNELTNSTIATDTHNLEENNQTLQLLPIKDDPQGHRMTLSQAFHIKNNNKKKQVTTEKSKQDANMLKKPVLGSYRGQIVQSKVNSFRKPIQVKDESSSTTKKLSTTISKATKPQPINISSITVECHRTSNVNTTKFVRTTSQNKQLLRPPIRSHHNNTHNTQDSLKQGINRTSANVTIRKGSHEKELLQLKTVLSSVKNSSSQEVKRNKTISRSITSEMTVRPASSSNTKLIEKSKTIDQRRHTIAKATIDSRWAQTKETAEDRKVRLSEWRASKGRMLKRPPSSVVTQPEPEEQNEKPVGSFWTTMAEEDEQRLFTEKVNKTFTECLNLINEGCPKEEVLDTLNDLVKNIPDAKKLVKYWICLARVEPLTTSIENIISIYEKAILAGAQPIEEMRHAIVDILTKKSQEKVKFGENVEEACATEKQIQEVNIEDIGVSPESGKPEMESKQNRNVIFQDCEKEQVHKTKDPTNDVKTPNTETKEGCVIKYNVSTTPYLQSVKKKMQFDEINSTFKELKFLTPVRRSRRLQDKTSKLPDMLKDHYPCVSSLEQLTELGDETDAFICRPNAALCRMYLEPETTEDK
ncbi:cytoskeleton-associated protein 2 isoform X1 [Molossus molossus]|uniref:Cytoskeleton associated protein 2 n=2 Tax=Molossus molossus TaxID=27622 RepID=A0A7J8GJK5_MOLMO|nr:cytoskeleton-associated protein 2 isoform X1 [Molossus molossus]KAF6460107.1 cytoskeleton associated protein 2 [Molossus molossus]